MPAVPHTDTWQQLQSLIASNGDTSDVNANDLIICLKIQLWYASYIIDIFCYCGLTNNLSKYFFRCTHFFKISYSFWPSDAIWWHGSESILAQAMALCRRHQAITWINVEHFPWTWWRHQMETFSALLAICAGNSPVSGEFPAQRPVTRNFDVFFDLCLNKPLSKQWWGWWF